MKYFTKICEKLNYIMQLLEETIFMQKEYANQAKAFPNYRN